MVKILQFGKQITDFREQNYATKKRKFISEASRTLIGPLSDSEKTYIRLSYN